MIFLLLSFLFGDRNQTLYVRLLRDLIRTTKPTTWTGASPQPRTGPRCGGAGGAYGGYGSAADDGRDECGADDRDDGGESAPNTVGPEASASFLKFRNFLTPPSFKTTNTQGWRSLVWQ